MENFSDSIDVWTSGFTCGCLLLSVYILHKLLQGFWDVYLQQCQRIEQKVSAFVAFKLSKRKPDENLRTLLNILFGKKGKVHNLKRNICLFSGCVWIENEKKPRGKVKERIDKCVKEKLVDFCDVLNIPRHKNSVKKVLARC